MKKKLMMAALVAAVSLLAGCSQGSKQTEAPAQTETAAKAETEETKVTAEAATEEMAQGAEVMSEAEEIISEAAEAVEEAASEAEGIVTETLTEAEQAVEEAVSEAEAAAEELLTEAAEAIEAVTEEAAETAATEEDETVAEEVTEAAAEEVTEAVTEAAIEEETEAVTEAVTEEVIEAATEAVTEEVTEAVTEAVTEEVTEAVTEAVTEEVTEAVTEAVTEEVAEIDTEAVTEEVADETEEVTEAASEEMEAVTEAESESEEIAPLVRPTYAALDYVTLGTYTDLPVEIDPIEVTDEEVEESIRDRVLNAGIYDEMTEGTVEDGDIANIDFVGKKDGEAFDGGTAEGYDLTIGSGTFIPGFEEGLIGTAIGDTVDLNLTFPEDYLSEELAGAEVVFTVTVNSVQRPSEINDEVISKLTEGNYSTLDGYRAYVREDLEAQEKSLQDSQINLELMTQLYNTCTVNEYPVELVDYSIYQMKSYYQQYAEMYGMEMGDFLATFFGMDEETFNSEVEAAVTENLQQELILAAIAEQEKLEVSEEEYQKTCEEYALEYGYPDVETFQEAYPRDQIEHSVRMDKALAFVHDHALITERETEAVTEEATEEAATEEMTE